MFWTGCPPRPHAPAGNRAATGWGIVAQHVPGQVLPLAGKGLPCPDCSAHDVEHASAALLTTLILAVLPSTTCATTSPVGMPVKCEMYDRPKPREVYLQRQSVPGNQGCRGAGTSLRGHSGAARAPALDQVLDHGHCLHGEGLPLELAQLVLHLPHHGLGQHLRPLHVERLDLGVALLDKVEHDLGVGPTAPRFRAAAGREAQPQQRRPQRAGDGRGVGRAGCPP